MLAEYRLREDVDVHADANSTSPVVAQYKFGDIITVEPGASGNGQWDGVMLPNGTRGWIHEKTKAIKITTRRIPAGHLQRLESGVPEEIGGWLVLFAIGLVVGPIFSLIGIVLSVGAMSGIPAQAQNVVALCIIADGAMLVFRLTAAILFFRKKQKFPAVYVVLLITGIVLDGILALAANGAGLEEFGIESAKSAFRSLVACIIWIPYLCVSERVKRTFVVP